MKYSLALHPLQYAITMRGLKLLRVGGRLVYSTCSLNPIEDEAVVMALLRRCRGAVRLVDVRTLYPALKRMPGLFTWQVCDQENHVYPEFAAIPEEQRRLYRETMFAPREEEARAAHLEWAMRFLPHQQDTGGFFVCVLEKVAEIPRAEKEEEEEEKEKMEEENTERKEEENKERKEEENKEKMEENKEMKEEEMKEMKEEKEEIKEEEEEGEVIGSEEENGDLVGIVKEEQR